MSEFTDRPAVELLSAREFHDEIVTVLPLVEHRALMTTMYMQVDDATRDVFGGLTETAGRDVRTQFQADSATYGLAPQDPGKDPAEAQKQWAEICAVRAKLEQAGGVFNWLNAFSPLKHKLPIWDINHIRAAVLDNTIWLAGPNLLKKDLQYGYDRVVRIHDASLADSMDAILFTDPDRVASPEPIAVQGIGKVIIDDSRFGRSRVHAEAFDKIATAQEIVRLAVRMPPTGYLARALQQARANGADVDVVAGTTGYKLQRHLRALLGSTVNQSYPTRTQTPESMERHGFIHSTLLRADETVMATTSTFDPLGPLVNMQEIGVFLDGQPNAAAHVDKVFASL